MLIIIIHKLILEFIFISTIINVPQQYPTIQQGIDAALNGDTVMVAGGIYTGTGNRDIDFQGKAILLTSGEWGADSTIIDCQADSTNPHRGVNFINGEDSFSVIDGFTITNGNAYGMNENRGGAIYIWDCSPKIINCIFSYNTALLGGAIYSISYGDPIIRNCWFHHNFSVHNGAGISFDSYVGGVCEAEVRNNLFENNISDHGGVAIYANQTQTEIIDNIIRYNTVTSPTIWGGGGISLWYGHQVVKNNLIYGNQAPRGGGIYIRYDGSIIANNTIFGNTAYRDGGGIYILNQSMETPTIRDCIIWNNSSTNSSSDQINISGEGSAYISYCCIEEGWTGTGIIDFDPLFVAGPNGDFYLSQTEAGQTLQSPCVDAGSNTAVNLDLDSFTTRTDHYSDNDQVDLGYHYPLDSNPGAVEEAPTPLFETAQMSLINLGNGEYQLILFLPQDDPVNIAIYDLGGRKLKTLMDQYLTRGIHHLDFSFNQSNFYCSSIYFLIMISSDQISSYKIWQIK